LLVVDEASQMPLCNGVGAVYRSKRAVIVGDEQQMSPTSYFKAGQNTVETILHQASYYWKQLALTYHYRAQNPALMLYSNANFYENKLRLFPTPEKEVPIELITVEGVYEERKNTVEAQQTAVSIKNVLKTENSIGVVAFSQAQLAEVIENLSSEEQQLMNENQHWMQSLENVQGDQCDHLIISLGYGYNPEGKFHLRFGPLSNAFGSRRLNVLMSRARKKITFIRSVKASDFPISDKEGVDGLRKLMLYLEQSKHFSQKFDFSTIFKDVEVQDKYLIVSKFYRNELQALPLIVNYKILTEKGWKIKLKLK